MTTFSDEVRDLVSPHKFGGSRMAAACYLVSLDGCEDERTGEAEWSGGSVSRIGRRIMTVDSQGFVYCETLDSEDEARREFQLIDLAYGEDLDAQEAESTAYAEGFRDIDPKSVDLFTIGDAVTVAGMSGIAYRVHGLPSWTNPYEDWSGITLYHPNRRLVHMVGDDREYDVHVDELTALDEDEFCGGCGQIGCGWC